jgi:glutamate/aspartate transport system substrate-binding protein
VITRVIRLLCAAVLAAAPAWTPVRAQEDSLLTGTLKTIHDRGSIRIGFREGAVPFAFRNRAGQPVGFSVDLCHGIAEDAATALHSDLLEPDAPAWQTGIRIDYVPVAAEARLPMLVSGAIDLECGSTTANAERARTIAFSPVFFVAGTKLLMKAENAVPSYRALGGKTIAVSAGTTNAAVMERLAGSVSPPLAVKPMQSVDAAFDAVAAGQADAVASDDILLAGVVALRGGGGKYRIIGDYLSYEPYAIGLRKDDPDFAALVSASFRRMAQAGILRFLYKRWFVDALPGGERLGLPMSPELTEILRGLGQPD